MLALTGNSRIYLYRMRCDLRKSFDGLCGIIRDHFREDPLWLFAGSERGAKPAALYMGLIQSCKALKINPWEYFDDMCYWS